MCRTRFDKRSRDGGAVSFVFIIMKEGVDEQTIYCGAWAFGEMVNLMMGMNELITALGHWTLFAASVGLFV